MSSFLARRFFKSCNSFRTPGLVSGVRHGPTQLVCISHLQSKAFSKWSRTACPLSLAFSNFSCTLGWFMEEPCLWKRLATSRILPHLSLMNVICNVSHEYVFSFEKHMTISNKLVDASQCFQFSHVTWTIYFSYQFLHPLADLYFKFHDYEST